MSGIFRIYESDTSLTDRQTDRDGQTADKRQTDRQERMQTGTQADRDGEQITDRLTLCLSLPVFRDFLCLFVSQSVFIFVFLNSALFTQSRVSSVGWFQEETMSQFRS